MTSPSQVILMLNIAFVVVVMLLLRRLLKAAEKFKWNPGDNEVQTKQKMTILKMIVAIAFVSLLAAIVNAVFG